MKAVTLFRTGIVFGIAMLAAPAARAAEVSHFNLNGHSLLGSWQSADECTISTTFMHFSESVSQIGGPPIVSPPTVLLEVDYQNFCNGDSFSLSGGAIISDVHFYGDLDSATMNAVIPVTDGNITVNVNLNGTWTGNAALQTARFHLRSKSGDTTVMEHANLNARTADTGGTITVVLPLSTGPSTVTLSQAGTGGQIGRDLVGDRVVTKM
jgi:hypothetical protein